MSTPVSDAVRERFLDQFFDAWPSRDVSDEHIRSSLVLTIEDEPDGQMVVVHLLGYTTGFGIEDGEGLEGVIDDLARHVAENAEADRWTAGDGWREYRS